MWFDMNVRPSLSSRRILNLAILAVILHALMPLLMALPQQVGMRMAVCSTQGVKSVFVQYDTSGKPAPGSDPVQRCPLCLAGAHLALNPLTDVQPALLAGLRHVQQSLPALGSVLAPGWPAYHSRAPPLV
ncbi:MAG: hypothetical protein H6R19_3588 [Proteobacteria bacterium]|nr:hypothetical protein [Pseudomonadota bacterium]